MKSDETQNKLEMSRYINLDLYHKVEMTHPYYREMLKEVLRQVSKNKNRKKTRILEIGAGTGLVTKFLAKIPGVVIDALDFDEECCKILAKHAKAENVNVIRGDAITFCSKERYDIVLSVFAHDHINFKDRFKFAKNIAKNLKESGVYIIGGEILPRFSSEKQRKNSLYLYHNFIIDKAKREGHHQLAVLEKEALISGLNKIGDFKRHVKMFEHEMRSADLKVKFKEKMGPKANTRRGGVYVYTFSR